MEFPLGFILDMFFLKTFCQQDHNLTTENFLADDHLKIKDFSKWEYIFLAKLEDKKNLQMIFFAVQFLGP